LENSPVGVCQPYAVDARIRIWIRKNILKLNSLSLICTIFILCTKECPFTGRYSAMLEIRDIEQQDRRSVFFKFLFWTGNDWQRSTSSLAALKAEKKRSTIAVVVVTMLPLIAEHHHNPALVSQVPW